MEDLAPLLIFIVVIVVNLVKFVTGKSGMTKPSPGQKGEAPPKRQPTSLAEFFEEITRKLEPQPTPLPDWPEDYERPDYMKEMEAFQQSRIVEQNPEQTAVPIPAPPTPMPIEKIIEIGQLSPQWTKKTTALLLPVQGTAFPSMSETHVSTPVLLRSATGKTDFDLRSRGQLRMAIIAGMIFGQPRAYDSSFDNTIAK